MTTLRFLPLAAAAILGGGLVTTPSPASAQSLAQRIAAAPDGTVRFSFNVRDGVCGDGQNVNFRRGSNEWESACENGPGRVSLDVAAHRVTGLRFYVGGHWRAGTTGTDLGLVSPSEASNWLLDLAAHGDHSVARHAVFPASIADSVVVWPKLLELARNESLSTDVRRDATFWLAQQAATAATKGLTDIVESSGEREVRRSAVFALSQRPAEEGVPALMNIAQHNRDPEMRRQAIFWLGQSHDPRALDFLREILAGR